MLIIGVALLLGLLFVSAVFSATETAFTSISDVKLQKLRQLGSPSAKKVIDICSHEKNLKKLLTLILLLNNLANIAAASLLTSLTIKLFGVSWIALASSFLTLIILIFAEVTPKQIAVTHNVAICLYSAQVIYLLQKIFAPIISVIFLTTNGLVRILGGSSQKNQQSLDDLYHMVNLAAARGLVAHHEQTLLHNMLRLNRMIARQIMTHRIDVFSLNEESSVKEAVGSSTLSSFRFIPLYRDDNERIVALCDSHDILLAYHQKKESLKLKELSRPALFVPELLKLSQLSLVMEQNQVNMVVLIDEYGGFSGLVSSADLAQAVFSSVGEQGMGEGIWRKDDGWVLRGKITLQQMERYFNLILSHSSESSTLSGYLLNLLESIPKIGATIQAPEGQYAILEIKKNRITQVLFRPYYTSLEKSD